MIKPDIIYEDEEMIVCRKPAGVLSQSGRTLEPDMVGMLRTYRIRKGEDSYVGIINRLDRPVEGLIVYAKTTKAAARLNSLLAAHSFNKVYIAAVRGEIMPPQGVFTDYIANDGRTNMSRIVSQQQAQEVRAKQAELEYEVLETLEDESGCISVVRVHLLTGRHHQIRVQFASRGHAIVGDTKYGAAETEARCAHGTSEMSRNTGSLHLERGGIALCACELDIEGKHFEVKPEFMRGK